MKWIGQHIWDFISRFRSDVYLEGTDSGTIASGGNLGLDSNNKIVKSASPAGEIDLASEVTGVLPVTNGGTGASSLTDNALLTGTGTSAVTAEANLTYNGSTETLEVTSSTSSKPVFKISNTNADAEGPVMQFFKNSSSPADDDELGHIQFMGDDSGGAAGVFAEIIGYAQDKDDGSEEGKLILKVASHDIEMQPGLSIFSGNADEEVDVTIGNGATSLTTIAGTLTMGSTAFVNNSGVVQVATQGTIDHDSLANYAANEHFTQANIVATGTIASGTWQGTAIASAYLDGDTAHLSVGQAFTGIQQINTRRFNITAGSSAGEYMGDVVYTGSTTGMTIGNCYYYKNDGTWALSNANADATATGLLAIALGDESDVDGMLLRGMVTTVAIAGTPDEGAKVYLRATNGILTTIAAGSGEFHRIIGYCMENSNNRIWFDPDKTWVEIA